MIPQEVYFAQRASTHRNGGLFTPIPVEPPKPYHGIQYTKMPAPPGNAGTDCSICMSDLGDPPDEKTTGLAMLKCNHMFHQSCIEEAARSQFQERANAARSDTRVVVNCTCPNCRVEIPLSSGSTPSGALTRFFRNIFSGDNH